MENDGRFLRVDPRSVEGTVRLLLLMAAAPPPQPSIDGPRGAVAHLRCTPVAGVGDPAGSSANAAYRYQKVEGHFRSD